MAQFFWCLQQYCPTLSSVAERASVNMAVAGFDSSLKFCKVWHCIHSVFLQSLLLSSRAAHLNLSLSQPWNLWNSELTDFSQANVCS